MIDYPQSLKATGGARTGVPPANLLDIQDVNGNLYYFSDRTINAPVAIDGGIAPYSSLVPPVAIPGGQQVAWALPSTAVATPGVPSIATNAMVSGLNGTLIQGEGDPFSTAGSIVWSGFTMPALPAGAVIDAVYITCLLVRGLGNAVVFTPFEPVAPAAGAKGQFSGLFSPTPTPAEIAAYTLGISMHATVGGEAYDELDISDVAIAIYFHLPGGGGNGGYTNPGEAPYGNGPYLPWLLSVPQFSFHRSMQTDMGSFMIQNVSGDTLSRDMEKILRASTLEGAMFVYRCWQPDAEAAWIEVHGQLTMGEDGVDTVELKGADLINAAQDDTPLEISCETCQLNWKLARCGATGDTECQYSYQTCQVPEKIMVVLNNFEKNYGESTANIAVRPINRARKF